MLISHNEETIEIFVNQAENENSPGSRPISFTIVRNPVKQNSDLNLMVVDLSLSLIPTIYLTIYGPNCNFE